MIWKKVGLIFDVNLKSKWMNSHAQVPFTLVLGSTVRVYFSTRGPADVSGMFKSYTGYVDFDSENDWKVLGIKDGTLGLLRDPPNVIDLSPKQFDGNLSLAFKKTKSKFCVISFSSDWLYPTNENKEIVIALNTCGANVGFVEINSDKGHDSFLLNVPEFLKTLSEFINSTYNEINNEKRI